MNFDKLIGHPFFISFNIGMIKMLIIKVPLHHKLEGLVKEKLTHKIVQPVVLPIVESERSGELTDSDS